MADLVCVTCGRRFQAKHPRARYCSERCRKRLQKTGVAALPVVALSDKPDAPAAAAVSVLAGRTVAELEAAGRLDTVLGQQAVAIARRLDSPGETGSAVAALSRELRAVMAEALAGVQVAGDPLDELRLRRDRKRDAG